MGVQVRVPGAGIVVVELRHDQTVGVDLPLTAITASGEGRLALDPGQRVVDALAVDALDRLPSLRIGQCPQGADGLLGGEHHVHPRHRLTHVGALRRRPGQQLPLGRGLVPELRPVVRVGQGSPQVRGDGFVDRLTGLGQLSQGGVVLGHQGNIVTELGELAAQRCVLQLRPGVEHGLGVGVAALPK